MQSKNGGGGVCSENLNCTIKVVETSQMVINVLFLKDIVLNYTTGKQALYILQYSNWIEKLTT